MENQIIAKVNNNVLRVERDELANSYEFYPQCSELNNIGVLSVEYDLPILKKLGYTFSPEHVNPTVGDTYIRDPFNKKHFIRIEDFTEEVIKVKQNCILRIVALLGAKDIELSVNVIRSEAREWQGKVSGKYKVTQAEIDIDRQKTMVMAQKYSTKSHFEPSITGEGYSQAVALSKEYGLYNETEVNTLLSWFAPDSNVKLTSHEIHFSMLNELNDSLDIAFNLNTMGGVFNLTTQFKRSVEIKNTIEGTMKMLF